MSRRSGLITGVILVLVMVGLWFVGTLRNSGTLGVRVAQTPTIIALADSIVTAKGAIVPVRFARMAFSASGVVAQVLVKEGDKLKAGDPIAVLDASDLKLQAQNAQDALDVALATLAQAKTPATSDEIAAAEANLRNAKANYDRAKNGATGAELAIVHAALAKAEAAMQTAQAAYDRIGGTSNPMIAMTPQALTLQQATNDYRIAKANYDLKVNADAAAVAAAEAAVSSAQAVLDAKKNGARPSDVAVLEARVKQSRTALAQAQAMLAKTTLAAPFDGTITGLTLRQGETINAGSSVATIADVSQWRVETSDLDEWGAARVKVGQPVKIYVNAFTSKTLGGKVTSIASQSVTLSTGDVSYVVTITLEQFDPDVRWGMSGKVEFQKQ